MARFEMPDDAMRGSSQNCQNWNIGQSLKTFPALRRCQHPATCQVLTDAALRRFPEFTVLVQCKLTSDRCEWVSYFSPGRHVLPADFGASTGERNSTDIAMFLQTLEADIISIYCVLFSTTLRIFGCGAALRQLFSLKCQFYRGRTCGARTIFLSRARRHAWRNFGFDCLPQYVV